MAVPAASADDPGMAGLGTNLREARERLGLTQEQVAERSGVHATEVSRIEGRQARPSGVDRAAARESAGDQARPVARLKREFRRPTSHARRPWRPAVRERRDERLAELGRGSPGR